MAAGKTCQFPSLEVSEALFERAEHVAAWLWIPPSGARGRRAEPCTETVPPQANHSSNAESQQDMVKQGDKDFTPKPPSFYYKLSHIRSCMLFS